MRVCFCLCKHMQTNRHPPLQPAAAPGDGRAVRSTPVHRGDADVAPEAGVPGGDFRDDGLVGHDLRVGVPGPRAEDHGRVQPLVQGVSAPSLLPVQQRHAGGRRYDAGAEGLGRP